ncbi:MAG TPA: hypothetical protein VIZ69_07845 [Thermoanaerobaculia bacterium]
MSELPGVMPSRRGFLGAALAAAAATLSRPFAARGQTTPAAPPAPAASPTPAPPDPKAEALAKLARERYGKFLSPEELTMLDERCAAIERRSQRLRAVRLSNGDEPVAEFRAGRL